MAQRPTPAAPQRPDPSGSSRTRPGPSTADDARRRLMGPVEFAMTRSGLAAAAQRVSAVAPSCLQVKVGVEAAGHYHRPVVDYRWPAGWEVLELNPAHVAEQRRVMGRRRVKTDGI